MIHSPIRKNRVMFIPDVHRPNMTVEILQIAEGKPEAREHPDTLKSGKLHKSLVQPGVRMCIVSTYDTFAIKKNRYQKVSVLFYIGTEP